MVKSPTNEHLSLDFPPELCEKLRYIAACEGRSVERQMAYALRQYIRRFEETNGPIPPGARGGK